MEKKFEKIIYEKKGQVADIILNNPEKLNAVDFVGMGGICDGFLAALTEAEEDDDVKVIVFKGAGRSFCSGRDLNIVGRVYGMPEKTGAGAKRPGQRIRLRKDTATFGDWFRRIFLCHKVTLSQVHGHCIGAGFEMVCASDLAICADSAIFGRPEQRLGGGGGASDVAPFIMSVGLKRALWLFLTTESIDGKEAEKIGLVNKSVEDDKLDEVVERAAKRVCLLGKDAIAIGKSRRLLVYESMGLLSSYFSTPIMHTLMTNVVWEPDEFIFFKERRDKGVRAAIQARDEPFQKA